MGRSAYTYQTNSYIEKIETKVKSCIESKKKGQYEVVLEDTVMFPEGGGQPSDNGSINDVAVIKLNSKNGDVIHLLSQPFEANEIVEVKVDWERRYDHMQQHTGQHLISAIALDERYNFETIGWGLGEQICTVDLKGDDITFERLVEIENICNKNIKERIPVIVHLHDSREDVDMSKSRKGIPDDVTGPIRLIEIDGIDQNLCCGTHVENLSDIHVVKILSVANVKGNARVSFVCGNRVLSIFSQMYSRELANNKLLCCGPEAHLEKISKVLKTTSANTSQLNALQKEVGGLLARTLIAEAVASNKSYICILRSGGDPNFTKEFLGEIEKSKVIDLAFVATCEIQGKSGNFVLWGSKEGLLTTLPTEVSTIIDGKFGGKKTRFQGKGNNLSSKSVALVEEKLTLAIQKFEE